MPLSKIKVIELGTLPAAAFCGRMFADFGADVLKVEPVGGDPGRRTAPLVDAGEGRWEGAYFSYLNIRKRSIILPQAEGAGSDSLNGLLNQADILIDSLSPQERLAMGVDHHALRISNPRLVILGMSWFGEDGPYSDFAGTDAVCRALAGATHLVGPKEGPPTPAPDYQASNVGGMTAFIAAMAGLQRQGSGSYRFELSVLESAITLTDYDIALSWAAGRRDQRLGNNRFFPNYPLGIYPCKQGWIGVTVVTPVQWRTFCSMLGIEDVATDPRYVERNGRLAASDELEARFKSAFLEKTADEWFSLAMENMFPMAVVPQMLDLLSDKEHERRQVFEQLNVGAHTYLSPANPLRLSATPPARNGRTPAAGEHSAQWSRPQSTGQAPTPSLPLEETPPPLQGIRIVDFAMGWAGPLATRHFADLGADVIKIEACQYPDWWRGVDDRPIVFEQRLYEKSAYFNVMNRNKRSITLDLTTARGVALVKELILKADIVIDNYSAGVMDKLGLGHDALERLKPNLIMLSMPAFGTDGPWRNCRAYGSTLEQASGLPQVVGRPQDPPMLNHIAYGDSIGGLHAASALLVALHHARRTGQGQRIVLSQVECMLTMVAPWLIQANATGQAPLRYGDGHPSHAPHGNYRCLGEDAWILIAVTGNESWNAMCDVIGRPDLANNPDLSSAEGRRAQSGLLREAIERWTSTQTPDGAMATLQARGVPAGASRLPTDLLKDSHLAERRFWKWIDRAHVGPHPQPTTGYREASLERVPMRPAPTLGESNTEVLQDMLGLTAQELEHLEEQRIIGTEALPPDQRKSRAATGKKRA